MPPFSIGVVRDRAHDRAHGREGMAVKVALLRVCSPLVHEREDVPLRDVVGARDGVVDEPGVGRRPADLQPPLPEDRGPHRRAVAEVRPRRPDEEGVVEGLERRRKALVHAEVPQRRPIAPGA